MQLVVHIYWCGWWRRIQISVGECTPSLFPPVKMTVQPLHWGPDLIDSKKQLARPDTSPSQASCSLTHPRLETTPRGGGWIDLNHPRRSSPGVIAHHWSKRTQRPPVTHHLWHPPFPNELTINMCWLCKQPSMGSMMDQTAWMQSGTMPSLPAAPLGPLPWVIKHAEQCPPC